MGQEWLATLIPFIAGILLLFFYKRLVTWWEVLIPVAISIIFILVFKAIAFDSAVSDTEYRGSLVTHAEYFEYYSTWVTKTCSEQYACGESCTGTGSSRTCTTQYCTRYYDCSYCDETRPKWYVVDNYGKRWSITQAYYAELQRKWKASPKFIDLNRSIDKNGSCGIDGNEYDIQWNRDAYTAETPNWTVGYTNYVQASHSAFKMPIISKKEADSFKLYEYPATLDYTQNPILGLTKVYGGTAADSLIKLYEYFNGYHGYKHHVKMFVLLFPNRPIDISFKQEYYWDGGNDNELVVTIGYDSITRKLNWVRAFGWSDQKRVFVDVREDLMETDTLDLFRFEPLLSNAVSSNWKPKNFEDFKYLCVELTPAQLIWIYAITLVLTIGCSIWAVMNEFTTEEDKRPNRW